MADHRLLTDRFLSSLPPAPRGQRVEVFDARVPGFGIRISDTKDADPARRGKAGRITFILYARFAAGAAPTRRIIGVYGAITLGGSTAHRRRMALPDRQGHRPCRGRGRSRARRKPVSGRCGSGIPSPSPPKPSSPTSWRRSGSGKMAERDLRSVFIAAWGERPVSEITKLDVLEIINAKKRTAPQMARALLVLIKRFFNWCDRPAHLRPDHVAMRPADPGRRSSASCSRAADASPTSSCSRSGEPPGAWATRLVRSIACCCSPGCGSTRPRRCRGRKFTATPSSSRRRG